MMICEAQAEERAVMAAAEAMCAAARTAPKACGVDILTTCILTGEDMEKLAAEMDRLADRDGLAFFHRDADNLRSSAAIVLIGAKNEPRRLGSACQFCGFESCRDCEEKGGRCAYISVDLGIAVGSAVSVAADHRIDNRVLFSAGKAALSLQLLGEQVCEAFGIPLSVRGKSPYFDRK